MLIKIKTSSESELSRIINTDYITEISIARTAVHITLLSQGEEGACWISLAEWTRIEPLLVTPDQDQTKWERWVAKRDGSPATAPIEDDRLLVRLSPWTQTASATLEPLTRAHITEPADEKAMRLRLADLWQAKEKALKAYRVNPIENHEVTFDYVKAAEDYADAARDYMERASSLPQPVIDAVTAVEHARAREKFMEPLPQFKALYAACRDALPAPRLMKRED